MPFRFSLMQVSNWGILHDQNSITYEIDLLFSVVVYWLNLASNKFPRLVQYLLIEITNRDPIWTELIFTNYGGKLKYASEFNFYPIY